MTKLRVPVTHIATGSSSGFLKYYAISALIGFLAVGSIAYWVLPTH
jgi:hypothetical protein